MMLQLSHLLPVAVGLSLAAAAGMRIFVPLLALGAAAHWGNIPLAHGFEWLAGIPALIALGTAAVAEVGAYYVPWLDHALDTIATPTAMAAGALATASVITDLPPELKWAITIIGGGGIAGLVQGASVLARVKSTATTGGIANPVVSTVELVGSLLTSIFAILVPVLCLALVLAFVVWIFRLSKRVIFGRRRIPSATGKT